MHYLEAVLSLVVELMLWHLGIYISMLMLTDTGYVQGSMNRLTKTGLTPVA